MLLLGKNWGREYKLERALENNRYGIFFISCSILFVGSNLFIKNQVPLILMSFYSIHQGILSLLIHLLLHLHYNAVITYVYLL